MRTVLAEALLLLEERERTVAELRSHLVRRHPADEVDAALAWLTERRLLSDARAAEAIVRARANGRRAESDARLRERLERRGASEEAISESLAEAPDEAARMREVLRARFRPEAGERAKAGRLLLSRGFEEEAIEGVLDRFFGEG